MAPLNAIVVADVFTESTGSMDAHTASIAMIWQSLGTPGNTKIKMLPQLLPLDIRTVSIQMESAWESASVARDAIMESGFLVSPEYTLSRARAVALNYAFRGESKDNCRSILFRKHKPAALINATGN